MHKRIRIARGDSSTQAFKDTVPEKGQPVYDTKDNKLYIGDGETALKDLDDIQVSNVTDKINGHDITDILESDGITAKVSAKIQFTTTAPTQDNTSGNLIIYIGSEPSSYKNNVLYLITL